MWTLSPEYIQQVKEELKGRRAAIQARHAEELKSLDTDLEEIETLERVAYSVAAKHLPEREEPALQIEAETAEGGAEPTPVAELEPDVFVKVAPVPVDPGPKSLSRWRMRLDAKSEAETA